MHEQGVVFDLPIAGGSVPTSLFCDYLYTRITRWRTYKQPSLWPWRGVIAGGHASTGYLQGILIENYHYVHAAAIRQSPLLSHAASPAIFDLVRDFVTGEAAHEGYFLETLIRWRLPAADVQQATPLTSTAEFIALQYRLAHQSILDYLAGSATLELEPQVYERDGDPYQTWETIYGIGPEVLAPVRQHIRDDVGSGIPNSSAPPRWRRPQPHCRWKQQRVPCRQRGQCSRPPGCGSATSMSTTSRAAATWGGRPCSVQPAR